LDCSWIAGIAELYHFPGACNSGFSWSEAGSQANLGCLL
jgi:hypothetical protein